MIIIRVRIIIYVILYFRALLLYLILVLISLFLFQPALQSFILILQHKILNESRDGRQLVLLLIYNRVVYSVLLICHYLRCSIAFGTFILAMEFSTKVEMLDISVLLWFDRREASFVADSNIIRHGSYLCIRVLSHERKHARNLEQKQNDNFINVKLS